MLTVLIIITSIALGGFVIYDLAENANEKREARKSEEARIASEARRKAEEKRLQVESAYNDKFEGLVSSYGPCTTDILLGNSKTDFDSHLYIFEASSMLVLKGEQIPFSKVLGFALNDESETIVRNEAQYTSTTKTATGNMLGRAVVGGVLLGGVGALAGATTAKKETVTTPINATSTSTTMHRYILYVNLDDLSDPTREIRLGSDTKKAQNIANIFNIIVQRNQK
jgi:hypothetical protein